MLFHRRFLGRLAIVLTLAALTGPAAAQLPPLPQVPGLPDVGQVARDALPEAERVPLDAVRRLGLRNLVRRNPRSLELERGDAIVRREVIAVAPSESVLAAARRAGFEIRDRERLDGLETDLVTLAAPEGMSTRRALDRLRALDPGGVYDFNHIYWSSGAPAAPRQGAGAGAGGARVGLIDGGVDARHPALAGIRVEARGFAGVGVTPSAHGLAVASLMNGAARIYAADVYGGAPTGGSASAIARAFSWMAAERVPVVNVSLVGPPNRALEVVVAGMTARGFVIVAAVGNDGPAAPPLYPAAYPGVVGVTGVSARNRVLPEAARGAHVDFAAPGADLTAASSDGRAMSVRGTSFASPIVAALLAGRLSAPSPQGAERAVADLAAQAVDLGARGRDDVYGAGLVGAEWRSAQAN
jgi:subtilisin family serine protease